MTIRLLVAAMAIGLAAGSATAAELAGEWSVSTADCDEMRVVYTTQGENPTLVNADGDWIEVSEPTTYEFDGETLFVETDRRRDAWTVTTLTGDRLEMVNQDPEAAEHGAGEASFVRCPPRN